MTNPLIRPETRDPFSRRSFLRAAGLGAAALGGTGLLAACGSTSTPVAGATTSATTSSAATSSAMSSAMSSSGAMSSTAMSSTAMSTGAMTSGAMSSGSMTSAAMASGGKKVAAGTYGTIALQLSWIKNIEFAGEFFADSKGYYTADGFTKVDLLAGGAAGTSAEALVLSKKALVGLSSPAITGPAVANESAPLKIIASTYQKNPFCLVSVKEKTPVATLADLKGKKIGVQTGGNETIFAGFLKANKIDASELTIVPVQYDPTVVITGTVDAFMAYLTNEPILLAGKGYTPVTLGFADNGLPFVAETYTVLQDSIDTKRDLLKAFLKAEIMGWTDAVADPAAAAALAVNNYGKDQKLDVAEQTKEATAQNGLISTADTKKNGILTMTDALIAENIKALGLIGVTLTADKLFDMSLLKEVYAENPSLIKG